MERSGYLIVALQEPRPRHDCRGSESERSSADPKPHAILPRVSQTQNPKESPGMANAAPTGAEFKTQLRQGAPKMGLFLNSHSPTLVEQLAHSGYDWLLVDTQHGPMDHEKLSTMLCAIGSGGAKSMVRVAGYHDRGGIQQALDLGADGVLIPYINTADEAR